MSKTAKHKSLKQRIAKLRLAVANEIIGNLAYTGRLQAYMQHTYHVAELCEQYSLLIVLNWIGTKYGFPICAGCIESDQRSQLLPLLSWTSLVDRYPLQISEVFSLEESKIQGIMASLDDCFSPDLELIGTLYQQILSAPLSIDHDATPNIDLRSDQRLAGEFYTPGWVADYAFSQWLKFDSDAIVAALNAGAAAQLPQVLDPSCGTGNFLHAALRLLEKIGVCGEQQLFFAANAVHGRDIDGRAVELARISLLLQLSQKFVDLKSKARRAEAIEKVLTGLEENVRVCDSLLDACAGISDSQKFDLVITNPPYISFGARDQKALTASWQHLLKRRFPASSEYKVRYTSIFQEIGIELINRSGRKEIIDAEPNTLSEQTMPLKGQCIYLVPDAFLTGSYYHKLRNLILRKVNIASLSELPASIIGGATVGRWCLAHYQQKVAPSNSSDSQLRTPLSNADFPGEESNQLVQLASISQDLNGELIGQTFAIPMNALISRDRQRFQLVLCQNELEILMHCRDFDWLGDVLEGHTGIRSRHGQTAIVARQKLTPLHSRGLISGSSLRMFNIEWRGDWLEIDPEKLFAGGFDRDVIAGPKILLRQTGDRIVAAVDLSGLFHLNNVHSFVPRQHDLRKTRTHYFACLLNSSFYLYYYRLKTREHKRALAQIDIETVEHMPLPPRNAAIEQRLEDLGAELSAAAKNDRSQLEWTARLNDAFVEIDQLVFDAFGISNQLRRHILASLGDEQKLAASFHPISLKR